MVNNNIVKAVRATVKFSEQIQVDGYMLPNGEFRVGKTSSSIAVGFGKDWLGQLEGNPLKALQSNGFTGSEEIVRLDSIKGGGTLAKTISLSDFKTLIIYASGKGKIKAQALLSALLDVGLEDWFRLSFGLN